MKRILVTGGNKGIGKAICERLLNEYPDTHVIMGARDVSRGQQAVQDLAKGGEGFESRLEVLEIDVSSDESVKKAADKMSSQEKLYGIINNAGIGWGHSMSHTINVNYYGPRRVNDAFMKCLQSPGGRIVHVASASGPNFVQSCSNKDELKKLLGKPWTIQGGIVGLDDIAKEISDKEGKNTKYGSIDNAYGVSKALLNAYTVWLGKSQDKVIVNSCSPGFIKTDLTSGTSASNPPSKGAVPPCWLMMEYSGDVQGRYYGSDCVRSPIDVYRDPGDAEYKSDKDVMDLSSETAASK